eukprot:Opistho-2@26388
MCRKAGHDRIGRLGTNGPEGPDDHRHVQDDRVHSGMRQRRPYASAPAIGNGLVGVLHVRCIVLPHGAAIAVRSACLCCDWRDRRGLGRRRRCRCGHSSRHSRSSRHRRGHGHEYGRRYSRRHGHGCDDRPWRSHPRRRAGRQHMPMQVDGRPPGVHHRGTPRPLARQDLVGNAARRAQERAHVLAALGRYVRRQHGQQPPDARARLFHAPRIIVQVGIDRPDLALNRCRVRPRRKSAHVVDKIPLDLVGWLVPAPRDGAFQALDVDAQKPFDMSRVSRGHVCTRHSYQDTCILARGHRHEQNKDHIIGLESRG